MSPSSPEAAAFEGAIRLVRAHAATAEQADLLATALRARPERDRGVGEEGYRRFVRLPLAVAEAVCDDATRAAPIAVVLALLHTGMDTLDDLMDGDARPWWRDYRPAEVLLAGATLISALPQIAIAELDAPPPTIALLQRTLVRAGIVISAGQQRDLAAAGRDDLTVEAVEELVAAKSGETHALAAALAAQIAGADAATVERYQRMGRALGTAAQIATDCHDLFLAPDSRDLQHGARTVPVVAGLRALSGDGRAALLALLRRAQSDAEARAAARSRLRALGAIRVSALIVAIYCRRAYAALAESGASGAAQDTLEQLIRDCSLVRPTLDRRTPP
jgi:geranylgeranyl pyrophosphate synthase